MPLNVGSRLGHYTVTALIGEGGMGQVYQATDTKLNRQVALKILPEAFATDPDRLARFQREAQVLASLNHPNIAAIHGLEESDDTRALVLELVEGPTLADRIKQGPIPIDEALPIAKQIAEALEAAHEAGVIHRDLKPANIKVKDDGTVKVLDFGLAKALDTSPEGDPSQSPTLTAAATQMGVILGTAAYMSPEQAAGKTVDKRGDIWSFGVVLFEMLTGQRVFTGETVSHVLGAVLQIDPNWDALPVPTPQPLRKLLRRCLQKDRTRRLRDIGDALMELDEALTAQPTDEIAVAPTAHPVGWQHMMPLVAAGGAAALVIGVTARSVMLGYQYAYPARGAWAAAVLTTGGAVWCLMRGWRHAMPLVVAGVAMALITGGAVWSLTRPAPPRLARFSIPLATDQSFSAVGRSLVTISPDGSQVVYQTNDGLWLRSIDQLQAVQVPGTAGTERAVGPFFSANGQSIGFWSDEQLKKVSVSGGAPVTLAEVPENPGGASWGADDMILRGGPHPLDRFSSQLRWNPIHDSSCFVCWLSSSPSVSVRFLRRPAVERRVGPAPVVEVHPQADSSPGLGASSELGQVDALVFE